MPDGKPMHLRTTVVELGFEVATAHVGWFFARLGSEVTVVDSNLPTILDHLAKIAGGSGEERDLSSLGLLTLLGGKKFVLSDESTAFAEAIQSAEIILWNSRAQGIATPDALLRRYPQALVVAVTPFGLTGERAWWQANDFLTYHAGGDAYFLPPGAGAGTRPPVAAGDFAPGRMAGWSMLATVLAHARQVRREGRGAILDISRQEALLDLSRVEIARAANSNLVESRFTKGYDTGGIMFARDRPVVLMPLEDHQWQRLFALLGEPDWSQEPEFATRAGRVKHAPELQARLQAWVADHTSDEIYSMGQDAGVPVGVVRKASDVVSAPQTQERRSIASELTPIGRPVLAPVLPFAVRHAEIWSNPDV